MGRRRGGGADAPPPTSVTRGCSDREGNRTVVRAVPALRPGGGVAARRATGCADSGSPDQPTAALAVRKSRFGNAARAAGESLLYAVTLATKPAAAPVRAPCSAASGAGGQCAGRRAFSAHQRPRRFAPHPQRAMCGAAGYHVPGAGGAKAATLVKRD